MERLSKINRIYSDALIGDYLLSGFYDAESYDYSFSEKETLFVNKLIAEKFSDEEIAQILRFRYWSFSNI